MRSQSGWHQRVDRSRLYDPSMKHLGNVLSSRPGN
jgi:hypothetical protein